MSEPLWSTSTLTRAQKWAKGYDIGEVNQEKVWHCIRLISDSTGTDHCRAILNSVFLDTPYSFWLRENRNVKFSMTDMMMQVKISLIKIAISSISSSQHQHQQQHQQQQEDDWNAQLSSARQVSPPLQISSRKIIPIINVYSKGGKQKHWQAGPKTGVREKDQTYFGCSESTNAYCC